MSRIRISCVTSPLGYPFLYSTTGIPNHADPIPLHMVDLIRLAQSYQGHKEHRSVLDENKRYFPISDLFTFLDVIHCPIGITINSYLEAHHNLHPSLHISTANRTEGEHCPVSNTALYFFPVKWKKLPLDFGKKI